MRRGALALAMLAGLVLPFAVPSASAACSPLGALQPPCPAPLAGTTCATPANIVLVPRCDVEAGLEVSLAALSAQTDGKITFVGVYDFRFHPENVTLHSGSTLMFLWLDGQIGNQIHDPRASGTTGSQALDVLKPEPYPQDGSHADFRANCFWNLMDQQHFLGGGQFAPVPTQGFGDFYNLTLRFYPSTGILSKSAGIGSGSLTYVGDEGPWPPQAQPFKDCPGNTASILGDTAVIPYHCGIHGVAGGGNIGMRGSITVIP